MAERSRDWLAQAERDLEEARWSLKGGFYEWVCFISQQAAEKVVKGLFQALHMEAWGHAVSKLLLNLPSDNLPPDELIYSAKRLDRFYIPPRYPNGFDSGAPKDYYNKEDAEESIADAEGILVFCKNIILRSE